MTILETYVSPYYGIIWGKEKWGNELRDKIQLKKITPPPNCQPLQCNPLKLVINNPHSMTWGLSSVLRCYGLRADLIGDTDPIGSFLLELLKEPATTAPSKALYPTIFSQLCHNQTGITIVEVKDLRKTIAIETGYRETNVWLEWIKYSVHTLNKNDCYTFATGKLEPQVVSFPLECTTNPAGMACMIAFFQEKMVWDNGSCKTLSLLFPAVNDHERLKLPPWIRPPSQSSDMPLASLGEEKG
jgi:hypothetical protein